MRERCTALLLCALLVVGCADSEVETTRPAAVEGPLSDGWLGRYDSHSERLLELESYLGGFSSAMWEVGERYRHLHQALLDENLPLANYHFDKIGGAIRNGYRKRPARREHADALFLDVVAQSAAEAFAGTDLAAAWQAFESIRAACQACHAAEDVAFMNDQPLLQRLRAP